MDDTGSCAVVMERVVSCCIVSMYWYSTGGMAAPVDAQNEIPIGMKKQSAQRNALLELVAKSLLDSRSRFQGCRAVYRCNAH